MEDWLAQDLCECEYGHTCGKDKRKKELEMMKQALSHPAPVDEEKEALKEALRLAVKAHIDSNSGKDIETGVVYFMNQARSRIVEGKNNETD